MCITSIDLFRKDRRTRDQIANVHWIIEKARELMLSLESVDARELMLLNCGFGKDS